MQYIVCQFGARQYLIKPGQVIEIDRLQEGETKLVSDKVLLSVADDKVEIGTPYLKRSVNFEILGNVKKKKIRVATYKAKSSHHRVVGSRRQMTQIKMEG